MSGIQSNLQSQITKLDNEVEENDDEMVAITTINNELKVKDYIVL